MSVETDPRFYERQLDTLIASAVILLEKQHEPFTVQTVATMVNEQIDPNSEAPELKSALSLEYLKQRAIDHLERRHGLEVKTLAETEAVHGFDTPQAYHAAGDALNQHADALLAE